MIGVIAKPSDFSVVEEFFELFKTPWEFYRHGQRYDVLLCCADSLTSEVTDAQLVVIYGFRIGVESPGVSRTDACTLSYKGSRLPLYCGSLSFDEGNCGLLADVESLRPVVRQTWRNGALVVTVGYDLVSEIRHLLTIGQPTRNAESPTLDLHIRFLRDVICSAGIPLIEIPPLPSGYQFVACLTHDVDHPFIRRHRFDHTMLGFAYRAVIGSAFNLMKRRISSLKLLKNLFALLKLPFVYLGVAKDFWSNFDRYVEIHEGKPSSFFIIPFRNTPGLKTLGTASQYRGAEYGASDVVAQVQRLLSANCEIGLHGIDAWMDAERGRKELDAIRLVTGTAELGVRMHWLFYDEHSPVALEEAGALYDSTVGYNEVVGYRAGSGQVYRPLNAKQLLELPLHIMDTALFYPSHLHLSPRDAAIKINEIVDNAAQHGGCVTVNWHDRSIAPERLWTDTYEHLVTELERQGAWFATASQATSWFRMRRSVRFEMQDDGGVRINVPANSHEKLPGLVLRTYDPASEQVKDITLNQRGDTLWFHPELIAR
jgi:hypothetical protein